ncbi:hypothetical protein Tsubulata_020414 [Turnera subulata]|uniref:Uncharacterized protein n=1 Tax=Turnera subulata TaxID=218843 RepID=A0A9Q0FIM9_9ROSI|nr:hypothetical protein Tsubulata_020414 [Turnera subulata]
MINHLVENVMLFAKLVATREASARQMETNIIAIVIVNLNMYLEHASFFWMMK